VSAFFCPALSATGWAYDDVGGLDDTLQDEIAQTAEPRRETP